VYNLGEMKRLLAYLFLVIGLGLIFSGSTFAKKIEIDLIFCAEKNNKNIVVASTKSKHHTLIGSSISEGKCGGARPKKISYSKWREWTKKKVIKL